LPASPSGSTIRRGTGRSASPTIPSASCGRNTSALTLTSTKHAPWFVIPANHKWFRDLAVSQIIADTMEDMGLKLPAAQVNIADIRRKYHAAVRDAEKDGKRRAKHVEPAQ
jgi:hypothetical protein